MSLPLLIAGAIGIALVAFAEAVGPANEFAREHGGNIDPNRELIAIGAANTSAGLFTGFPIGSSLSKSAANDRAGARTPASLVTAAAATALVALFLTPLFEPLPEATLGAIVIVAVFGMMKVDKMRRLWKLRRIDFWLAMIALVGVLVDAHPGGARARRRRLAGRPGLARQRGAHDLPGPGQRRPGAAWTCGARRRRPSRGCSSCAPTRCSSSPTSPRCATGSSRSPRRRSRAPSVVLLDLSLTPEVDVPVVEALEDLHGRLAADGIELWLAGLRPDATDLLDRAGTLAAIGATRIYPRVVDGILAFALRMPDARERVAVLTDLLAYIRERAAQPGTSAAGVETLNALEQRLAAELAAVGGASA